ncbi:MAG: FkbM family methyltransferase [Candidatus Eisenbacteria bacterium]|uniref:FkbM family methyltransferase n=1 Tax=Eiseniibacteriota bacterium TaxID=2212470 RepID=A0A933SBI3_UNCEI|nr:FkbM family methyltransferase [Candidatus Eisenbacteria bacterium]
MRLDPALARFTRRVPRFRGWHRLLEPLRLHDVRAWTGRADRWIVIDDFEGALRMKLDRAAYMGSLIYWRGIHSFAEAAMVRRFLPGDGVFLDVGANQGELTLVAAHRAPRGRVYAFEPVPEWFARLEENVALNAFTHVRAFRLALSDTEGEVEMFASAAGHGDADYNEGLSSLHRSETRSVSVGSFPTLPLDAFAAREGLDRIDLIKIDVEGAEERVLAGGRETLARLRPVLVLEWKPDALADAGTSGDGLLATLRALGYACFEVDPFARVREVPAGQRPRHDTLLARHASGR